MSRRRTHGLLIDELLIRNTKAASTPVSRQADRTGFCDAVSAAEVGGIDSLGVGHRIINLDVGNRNERILTVEHRETREALSNPSQAGFSFTDSHLQILIYRQKTMPPCAAAHADTGALMCQ